MSKQLALSSSLSVLAMTSFALFGSAEAGKQPAGPASPISVEAPAGLPALGSFLPSLR